MQGTGFRVSNKATMHAAFEMSWYPPIKEWMQAKLHELFSYLSVSSRPLVHPVSKNRKGYGPTSRFFSITAWCQRRATKLWHQLMQEHIKRMLKLRELFSYLSSRPLVHLVSRSRKPYGPTSRFSSLKMPTETPCKLWSSHQPGTH